MPSKIVLITVMNVEKLIAVLASLFNMKQVKFIYVV